MISPSLFVLFFVLNASNVWDIGELHQARKTIKYDMYKLVLYLNLYSAIWSSSDRGWHWQVGWNNWEAATIMPIIGCILHLPVSILSAFVSVYQKITIMQQAGKCWLVHIFGFFCHPPPFFLVILSFWSAFVWGESCCCCCCGRTIGGLRWPHGWLS